MPPTKSKTGVKKKDQRKQMYVYTDHWVAMHNKIQQLEHQLRYWMIEAETDHNRWLRALEEIESLRNKK
jgi:hypothetical protein